jgi:hypothetical protein
LFRKIDVININMENPGFEKFSPKIDNTFGGAAFLRSVL